MQDEKMGKEGMTMALRSRKEEHKEGQEGPREATRDRKGLERSPAWIS